MKKWRWFIVILLISVVFLVMGAGVKKKYVVKMESHKQVSLNVLELQKSKTVIDHEYQVPITLSIKEQVPGCSSEPQEMNIGVNLTIRVYYNPDTGEMFIRIPSYTYNFNWGGSEVQEDEKK